MSDTREKIVSSYVSFYEGYEEKALTSADAIFSDQSSGLWKPETNTFMDFLTLKSLYHTEDWVFILVDRIASKISSQYLRVMKDEVVDGKKVSRPAEGHPAQAIIDSPNEVQDYHTWMYSLVADDCILGNSFQWFSKSLGQIIPIPGENVRPFFDGKGQLTKYIIVQNQEDGIQPKSWSLNVDEICHIRRPNPSSMYVGLSPFVAAQKSLLFSRYSAEYLNNFYIKGAQPGIVLEMGVEANQEMALRLLRSMENAYTGRRNQRRSMVLPRGVKATQLSTSIADQQLIDLINQNREKIINILQVPKHELSIAESGSLGSEEYKAAIKNFWRGPLRNTMRRVAGALALKMKDALGEGYYLEFDLSDVEYLADDERTKAETANLMLQTHTLNEVRSKVYDMKPLAEGDKAPGAVPQASPFQIYGLPKPETAIAIEAVPLDVMDTKAIDRVDLFLKSNGGKWWERRQEIETDGQKIAQEKMSVLALALLGDQVNAAVKAIKGKKAAPTEAELRKRIKEALAKMEKDYVDGFGEALSGTVEMGYDAALQLPFDLPNKDALDAIRSRNERRRYSLLETRGLDSFDSVSKTTTDKIMQIIGDEMAKSASIKEITDSILAKFSDEINAARAVRIARTESLMAQSIGQAAAMKDAERSTGEKIWKMWVNAGDERVRGNPGGLYPNAEHDHWVLQGQVRPSSKSFSNGLMFPRDPSGEAGDVINCRCTWLMVPASEKDRLGEWKDELNTEG